ncbi:MAG: hypothetical protein R2864_08620 [Syntrophotaleaceae bacterium]
MCLYLLFFLKGLHYNQVMPRRPKSQAALCGCTVAGLHPGQGKHATYIVPFTGWLLLWAAEAYARLAMPCFEGGAGHDGFADPGSFSGGIYRSSLSGGWQIGSIVATLPLAWVAWQAFRQRHTQRLLIWTAAGLMLTGCLGYGLFGQVAQSRRGYERLTARLNTLDPDRRLPVLVYRKCLPSISFYRGALAVMALGKEREVQFERTPDYHTYYLTSPEEVQAFLAGYDRLFVVAEPEQMPELIARQGWFVTRWPLTAG